MKMMFVGGRKHGDITFSDYPPERVHMYQELMLFLRPENLPDELKDEPVKIETYTRHFYSHKPNIPEHLLSSGCTNTIAVYRHETVSNAEWKQWLRLTLGI